jgi:hypothetical protein
MSQAMMTVVSQTEIAKDIFELRLKGALVNEMGAPDQFLHIRVPGDELLLRRPISIASIDADKGRMRHYLPYRRKRHYHHQPAYSRRRIGHPGAVGQRLSDRYARRRSECSADRGRHRCSSAL